MPHLKGLVPIAVVAALLLSSIACAQSEPPLPANLVDMRNLLRDGKVEAAVEKGEALVAAEAGNAGAWQWLGHAYARQAIEANVLTKLSWAGKSRDAYEKAVALDGKDPQKRLDLLTYYAQAPAIAGGGMDKARAEAERIVALDAGHGHLAKAQLARIDKDDAAAERELRAALDTLANKRRARLALASFYVAGKRWGDVRSVWTAALAENPADASAIYMIGRTAALSGEDLDAGLASLERYLALPEKDPEFSTAAAHWRKGLILEKLGRVADAIAAMRKAVELDPTLADAKKDLKRLL